MHVNVHVVWFKLSIQEKYNRTHITIYTCILADSHISRPLKISVKMMICDTCNNVIIVMRV